MNSEHHRLSHCPFTTEWLFGHLFIMWFVCPKIKLLCFTY